MAAKSIADGKEHLAREAQAIAERAARFAKNIEHGIASGDHALLALEAQRFLVRAIRYEAIREAAALFTTELAGVPAASPGTAAPSP